MTGVVAATSRLVPRRSPVPALTNVRRVRRVRHHSAPSPSPAWSTRLPARTTATPVPMMTTAIRLGVALVGTIGFALSYDALRQMAVAIHIRGVLTYAFPLVIDGFIAIGVAALLILRAAPLALSPLRLGPRRHRHHHEHLGKRPARRPSPTRRATPPDSTWTTSPSAPCRPSPRSRSPEPSTWISSYAASPPDGTRLNQSAFSATFTSRTCCGPLRTAMRPMPRRRRHKHGLKLWRMTSRRRRTPGRGGGGPSAPEPDHGAASPAFPRKRSWLSAAPRPWAAKDVSPAATSKRRSEPKATPSVKTASPRSPVACRPNSTARVSTPLHEGPANFHPPQHQEGPTDARIAE